MTHYTTSRGWIADRLYSDDTPMLADLSVSGPKRVDTGLVTERGEAIYRMQPPAGFGRDKEWA